MNRQSTQNVARPGRGRNLRPGSPCWVPRHAWALLCGPLLAALLISGGCAGGGGGGGEDESEPGEPSTITLVEELPEGHASCPYGGHRIYFGIDDNSNGVLDEAEVDGFVDICNGEPGYDHKISMSPEPEGPNCAYGGIRIDGGSDLDRDGVLDPGEITETEYVCNGSEEGGDPLAELVSLEINAISPTLALDGTVQLNVTGTFSDDSTADITFFIEWASSNTDAATVSDSGLVTGVGTGTATLTATEPDSGLDDEVELLVVLGGEPLSGTLAIHPPDQTIGLTESIQFIALAEDAEGIPVELAGTVAWESEDTGVAQIGATGLATAMGTGTATIKATFTPPATGVPEFVSTTLMVQTEPVGAGGQVDWVSSEVVGLLDLDGFVEATDGAAPDGFEPHVFAHYTEIAPPQAGTQIVLRNGYDSQSESWDQEVMIGVAGQSTGVYDIEVDAFGLSTVSTPIADTLEAGPEVEGSSGLVVITRMDAPGGRIEGYQDIVVCSGLIGCAARVRGAFSVTREADDVLADEGTAEAPQLLSVDINHSGRVGTGSSFYTVPVAEDTAYEFNLRSPSDDVDLFVFSDSDFTQPLCSSQEAGTDDEYCADISPEGVTDLYLRADYAGAGNGAVYTLSVNSTPYAPEGTAEIPVDLIPSGPTNGRTDFDHNGSVDYTISYYLLPVAENAGVNIALSPEFGLDPEDLPVLGVFTDDTYSIPFCTPAVDGENAATCDGTTGGGAANLWITVDGAATGIGAFYNLSATMLEDEGDSGTPAAVSLGQPRGGAVAQGTSYYVAPVTDGLDYLIELSGLSADVTLTVYSDQFSSQECQSAQSGTADESCLVTAAGDSLYFTVNGSATAAGAFFAIFAQRDFQSEGLPGDPQALTIGTPHTGTVAAGGTSYYTAVRDQLKNYTVTVLGADGELSVLVLDGSGENPLCGDSLFPLDILDCFIFEGSGNPQIEVSSSFGDEFIIGVTEGFFFAESAPLTDSVPHDGQVDRSESTYGAPVVPGIEYTVTVASPTDDVDLLVIDLLGATLCESAQDGTLAESCSFTPAEDSVTMIVDGSKTFAGATYTISFAGTFPVAEGDELEPDLVVPEAPHPGQVDNAASYYLADGLPPNTVHRIQLSGLTDDAELVVYLDGFFAAGEFCQSSNPGTSDEFCDIATDADGELYIFVDGNSTLVGAFFILLVGTTPDLTISIGAVADNQDDTADVTFTILNSGFFPLELGSFFVDFFPNPGQAPTIDDFGTDFVQLFDVQLDGGGDSQTFIQTFSLGGEAGGGATAYMTVDSFFDIAESDETNNVSSGFSW